MGKIESRFNGMSLDQIFKEVLINKENWSKQKQEAVDYICENYTLNPQSQYIKSLKELEETDLSSDTKVNCIKAKTLIRDITEGLNTEPVNSISEIMELIHEKISLLAK